MKKRKRTNERYPYSRNTMEYPPPLNACNELTAHLRKTQSNQIQTHYSYVRCIENIVTFNIICVLPFLYEQNAKNAVKYRYPRQDKVRGASEGERAWQDMQRGYIHKTRVHSQRWSARWRVDAGVGAGRASVPCVATNTHDIVETEKQEPSSIKLQAVPQFLLISSNLCSMVIRIHRIHRSFFNSVCFFLSLVLSESSSLSSSSNSLSLRISPPSLILSVSWCGI